MKSTLMKKTIVALAVGCLGLIATGAQADGARGGDGHGHGDRNDHGVQNGQHVRQSRIYGQQIDLRRSRQRQRILAGLRSGNLTHAEFHALMRQQLQIRTMERRFRADGRIDRREFQRLDHVLDVASRRITAESHDHQARYASRPRARFD